MAFINNHNLGRYWPVLGPQQTLYVPGVWIQPKCQLNKIIIFEQDKAPLENPIVKLIPYPILDGPTPNST